MKTKTPVKRQYNTRFIIQPVNESVAVLEYSREVTWRTFGPKLLAQASRDDGMEPALDWNNYPTEEDKMSHIFLIFELIDDSPNHVYVPFIAKHYAAGGWGAQVEDLWSKIKPSLEKFDLLKKRNKLAPEHKDIMRYRNFQEFVMTVAAYPDELTEKKEMDKGEAKEIFNNDQVRIIIPHDKAAAIYYGQGTQWCTASQTSYNYFEQYNDDGILYIMLPKHPKHIGEKYQLWFAFSNDNYDADHYMDENDDNANLKELITERFGDLREFFFTQVDRHLEQFLLFANDDLINMIIADLDKVVSKRALLMMNEQESRYPTKKDFKEAKGDFLADLASIQSYISAGSIKDYQEGNNEDYYSNGSLGQKLFDMSEAYAYVFYDGRADLGIDDPFNIFDDLFTWIREQTDVEFGEDDDYTIHVAAATYRR